MLNQFLQLKWIRILLTMLVVYILSVLTVFLIVTAYATYLAFQARGAPDQNLIQAFANLLAPWIGPASLILFTFLGARHIVRRVEAVRPLHGISLGILVSLLNVVLNFSFSPPLIITTLLLIGGGWLGSKLSLAR